MAFIPPVIKSSTEPIEEVKYDHGFTEEQVALIESKINKLESSEVSLEDFKNFVVPWFRIHRTKEFILHPEKVKPTREPKPKTVRVKKLTKKQTMEKMQELIVKLSKGIAFTEEETKFFNEQTESR